MNAKLWWRSLKGVELAAIFFYGFFVLLIAGQFMRVIFLLLFTPDIEISQQFYPWLTEDIQYFIHLLFVNILWFNQIFFTKINRLQISENRKLLTFGVPVRRLSVYLNLAGFFHPVNVLFHFFWILYLSFLVESPLQLVASLLLVIANYTLIHSMKWRFRVFAAEKFKQVGTVVASGLIIVVLVVLYLDVTPFLRSIADVEAMFSSWLVYSPGYIFYYIFALVENSGKILFIAGMLTFIIGGTLIDMIRNTRIALLSPASTTSTTVKSGQLAVFIKWLGHEGGKYFYSVWNHKYSKIQLLMTYVFVLPYIIFLGDTSYIIGVFLTLIPIIFLMVMLTNMFGFENRELLLSLQFPVSVGKIVQKRIQAAIAVCLGGSSIVFVLIPVFIESILAMLQIYLGVVMISLVFLHYILKSSTTNYKKIEEVSVMSVSNPVLPASVTFISVFIVMILGIFVFVIADEFIWYHITALVIVDILLLIRFRKKLNRIQESFKHYVIPRLWNEL